MTARRERPGADRPAATALQFLRFLATGLLNTAVGLSIIWFCWHVLGMSEVAANFIGYAVGLCVSFWVNRRWTFRSRRSMRTAVPRFLAVFVVAYLSNLATLLFLLDIVHLRMEFATVIATVPYTLVFYLGSRWFVFPAREKDDDNEEEDEDDDASALQPKGTP